MIRIQTGLPAESVFEVRVDGLVLPNTVGPNPKQSESLEGGTISKPTTGTVND